MRRQAAAVVMMLAAWWSVPEALQPEMNLQAIDEALALGRTGITAERVRFHEPYRVYVARAPVDYLEIVTPFRRVVLAAQGRAAVGDRSFGQRQALDLLATAGEQIDVYLELTFHPLNTYVGVPGYDVALIGPRGVRLNARAIDRISRWTPRVDGLPPPVPTSGGILVAPRSQPLLGATVIAAFDLRALDPKESYEVVIVEEGEERARTRVDLGRMR